MDSQEVDKLRFHRQLYQDSVIYLQPGFSVFCESFPIATQRFLNLFPNEKQHEKDKFCSVPTVSIQSRGINWSRRWLVGQGGGDSDWVHSRR